MFSSLSFHLFTLFFPAQKRRETLLNCSVMKLIFRFSDLFCKKLHQTNFYTQKIFIWIVHFDCYKQKPVHIFKMSEVQSASQVFSWSKYFENGTNSATHCVWLIIIFYKTFTLFSHLSVRRPKTHVRRNTVSGRLGDIREGAANDDVFFDDEDRHSALSDQSEMRRKHGFPMISEGRFSLASRADGSSRPLSELRAQIDKLLC